MEAALVQRACWCGGSVAHAKFEFKTPVGGFPAVQCENCGVLALFPQPDEAALARAYSDEYYGVPRLKFIRPIASIIGWIQARKARWASGLCAKIKSPHRPRLLDIGCGNGGFMLQMGRLGFDVEGTEYSSQSAARIPVGSGAVVHIGNVTSLNLPAASYDLVTLWHVFEHLREPPSVLLEIKRLLKPDGRLVLAVPNAESAQARRFGEHWLHHDPPRHLYGFGPRSLGKLLNITGFEIVDHSMYSLEQNPFGWIQSHLNQRGYPRDRLYESLKKQGQCSLKARAVDLGWFGLLAIPALIVSSLESSHGEGATMRIVARIKSRR